MARLAVDKETLKQLALRSRNQCAFPGCSHPLIDDDNRFVAELCHITAAEPGGERYNEFQTDEERRAYANLMFLCHRHHKETDDTKKYTVATMREMKRKHEALPASAHNPDEIVKGLAKLEQKAALLVAQLTLLLQDQCAPAGVGHLPLSAKPASASGRESLERHLQGMIRMFSLSPSSQTYLRRKALIIPGGQEVNEIEDWLVGRCGSTAGGQMTIVLGEYGYGKTSLCLQVASKRAESLLAGKKGNVPVYMFPEKETLESTGDSYAKRFASAVRPGVSAAMLDEWLESGSATVFVDGLDEMLGAMSQEKRIRCVRSLIALPLEHGNNVVLTCRTHLFETLGEAQLLLSGLTSPEVDRTASVVAQLLRDVRSPAKVEDGKVALLKALSDDDLQQFMRASNCMPEWERAKHVPGVVELARRPVLLYLIGQMVTNLPSEASKAIGAEKKLSVSALYELAIRTWVRRDAGCAGLREEQVFELLEATAMEFWGHTFELHSVRGNLTGFAGGMAHWQSIISRYRDIAPKLERAGLLVDGRSAQMMPFLHYSFLEFFLARVVATQMRSFDASTLAMLNLVSMYTVNQFLVEQVKAQSPLMKPSRAASSFPCRTYSGGQVMTRPVSESEFTAFLESSGWREGGLLWGYSNSRAAGAAVRPLVGMDLENFEWGIPRQRGDAPVTNVSWYDACMFAKYFGGRLCACEEIDGSSNPSEEPGWEWTDDWLDYGSALMSVKSTDGRIGGANPDVRDSRIGFRVAWSSVLSDKFAT